MKILVVAVHGKFISDLYRIPDKVQAAMMWSFLIMEL
jgi:hypothetical protein